jgi:hypothetical protein
MQRDNHTSDEPTKEFLRLKAGSREYGHGAGGMEQGGLPTHSLISSSAYKGKSPGTVISPGL